MMERRAFLATTALLAAPLAVGAQRGEGVPDRVPRGHSVHAAESIYLGCVPPGTARAGLDRGSERRHRTRFTQGRPERFPELVAEVLRIQVDVIVVADSQAAWAAKRATDTTPIVLASVADAVGQGLVASLARPGGNITGLSNQLEETIGKLVQTLKEIVPGLARLGVIHNPNNPASHRESRGSGGGPLGHQGGSGGVPHPR